MMMLDINGLDSDTLASINKLASEKDYQLLMEKTDESGKVGVFIRDGAVAAIDGEEVK